MTDMKLLDSAELMDEEDVFITSDFKQAMKMSNIKQNLILTTGVSGVGRAVYVRNNLKGKPSSGSVSEFYDANGNGWWLDISMGPISSTTFGLIGDESDETEKIIEALNFSSSRKHPIRICTQSIGRYYLFGQVIVPNDTQVIWDANVRVKARDDLKQSHISTANSFEVLFRFQDTINAKWWCNGFEAFYDKTKYSGEHNHIFMFDAAENIYIYDAYALESAGDGFFISGRFSSKRAYCKNINLINPVAIKSRRNGLSVTSVDGLYVWNYHFSESGIDGANPSGPCAGIDIEPEAYTKFIKCRFYGGVTDKNLRQGTVFAFAKLLPTVEVDIEFNSPHSSFDSRGFEFFRGSEGQVGLIRINSPLIKNSRYSAIRALNWSANGVTVKVDSPIAVNPNTTGSTQGITSGSAAYYLVAYNDGGKSRDLFPQSIGGIQFIKAKIIYTDENLVKVNYGFRGNIVDSTIIEKETNTILRSNITIDNTTLANPDFGSPGSYFLLEPWYLSSPTGLTYNPYLDFRVISDDRQKYRKDVSGSGFNSRATPFRVITNQGTTSAATFFINETVVGREFEFLVLSPNKLKIRPQGTGTIIPLLYQNNGSKVISCDKVGSSIKLSCQLIDNMATWVVVSMIGNWVEDEAKEPSAITPETNFTV